MTEEQARQEGFPVAVGRETGEPVNLARWREDPAAAIEPNSLSMEQQIALVSSRWRAGAWHNVALTTEGEIDVDRAVRELEARTDIGLELLAIGLRAMELARADAWRGEQG